MTISFDLFRYQLLPTTQKQQELFQTHYTVDDIRRRKNEFLQTALDGDLQFRHRGFEIKHIIQFNQDHLLLFKIGAHKSVDRDNEDFRKERIESWPNVTVLVNNDPKIQIIAISKNIKAFSSSRIVANLFESALTNALRHYGLTIQLKELFEKNNFWSIINNHPGKITRVKFEMVSPNMANISHTLKIDFKQLNRESNCQKVNLGLETLPGAPLEIKPDNKLVNGCIDYASKGGGDIAIKVRGIKKEFRTSTVVRSIEIDELYISSGNEHLLNSLFNQF